MRWPTWLRRTGRHRAPDLAAAAEAGEQAAARQRVLDLARRDRWPGWNAPTAAYRPLMTRGQAARGHGGHRP
jgi:hypothetical protein